MKMKKNHVLAVALGLVCLSHQMHGAVSVSGRAANSGEAGVVFIVDEGALPLSEIDRAFAELPEPGDAAFEVWIRGVGEVEYARVEKAFLAFDGSLAERLLAGVEALIYDGTGFEDRAYRCALVVRNATGGTELELGLDGSLESIDEVGQSLAARRAGEVMTAAEQSWREGDAEAAEQGIARAIAMGASSDDIWLRAARLTLAMGHVEPCIQYLSMYAALNNHGAQVEFRDSIYDPIRERQDFQFVEDSLVYQNAPVP